jgi:hypothetical protein
MACAVCFPEKSFTQWRGGAMSVEIASFDLDPQAKLLPNRRAK